jgi:uncharacterized membrane protein
MEKKSKYDTNPLDPDVARRTDDVWGARTAGEMSMSGTEEAESVTRNINHPLPQAAETEDYGTEAPTRRYDNPRLPGSYPSVFIPPVYEPPSAQGQGTGINASASASHAPSNLHGAAQPFKQPPSSRNVANINMPENVVMMLPYVPFPFVGAAVAAILLFLIPRNEPRARFHAAQGMALHLIVLAVSLLTGIVDDFLSGAPGVILNISSAAFSVLAFIFFIVSMIRVYKGEPHVVAPLTELTNWLNEKVEPKK